MTAVNNNFPKAPWKFALDLPTLKIMVRAINSVVQGKLNCCGVVTCSASVATTTINDPLCNANSVILFSATTAHAAAELATFYYVPGDGKFVLHHANNAQIDRTFTYVIIG